MAELKLPKIGLGTMQSNSEKAKEAIKFGINYGFRFIDTAQIYFNEKTVGKAIAESEVPREEIILATKLWLSNFNYTRAKKSTERSLKRLQLDYIDVLYIHWPIKKRSKLKSTLKAMDELIEAGKIKHIAVSNFTPKLLDEAQTITENHIIANQVEMHPWLQQRELLEHLTKNKIKLVAYFPLIHGRFNQVPELVSIAQKHKVSAAQVSLAWIMSKGAVPIPKSANVEHLKSNFEASKLKLDSEDIKLIDSIKKEKRFADIPFIRPEW